MSTLEVYGRSRAVRGAPISPSPLTDPELLAAFPAPLAEAVEAVLSDAGVPSALRAGATEDEVEVLVPRTARERAFTVLAERMDDIHRRAASTVPPAPFDPADDELDDAPRPLVMERFRSMGFLAFALVPLLVVSLSRVQVPAAYAAAVAAGVAIAFGLWRAGRATR